MVALSELHTRPAFDPFHDRSCRDLRNELSEELMAMIHGADRSIATTLMEEYRSRCINPTLREYLEDRLTRYQWVLAQIAATGAGVDDTYEIAVLLWDLGLFFEVHEWLEGKWLTASGVEKEVLQALIRAAGTYIHLRHGRPEGAAKMAAKAVAALRTHQALVPRVFDVEVLLAKLAVLDPVPPTFGRAQERLNYSAPALV